MFFSGSTSEIKTSTKRLFDKEVEADSPRPCPLSCECTALVPQLGRRTTVLCTRDIRGLSAERDQFSIARSYTLARRAKPQVGDENNRAGLAEF